MDLSSNFLGSLYQGDQVTKEWNVIGKGHVYLRIFLCSKTKKWKLEASKDKKSKIWECFVDDTFTFKLRDNFVQWSFTNSTKQKCTFGFRIKELTLAQELTEMLKYISSNPPASERCVNITLPSKHQVSLYFKNSITMASVLKLISAQNGLEASIYALARMTQSGVTPLKPQAVVGDLETPDIVFVKRHKPTSETTTADVVKQQSPSAENAVLMTITLPNETPFKVKVKHDITLLELLKLVCLKNGLNYTAHEFDLPIANQDKIKLKQLKLSVISLKRKEGIPDDEAEGTDGGTVNTPKMKLRVAPPPPPISPQSRPRLYSSPSSSPSSKKATESTDSGKSTEDVNDFISRMLSQQAVGKSSPLVTSSPSKESTRRKLHPAPAPPSSHNRLAPLPPHSKSGSVKRAAPPPPSATNKDVSKQQHESEQVDGDEKKHYLPHGAVPLPSMTNKIGKGTGTHQNTIVQPAPLDGGNATPTLSRDIPLSPRKPVRKAPTKPPPKGSGFTPPLSAANLTSHELPNRKTNDNSHLISENKPIATTASTSVPTSVPIVQGPLQFKFPPPPPKSLLPKPKDVAVETIPTEDLQTDPSDTSSIAESDHEDSSADSTDDQSSTNGGYDVQSGGESDHDGSTSTADSSSDSSDHEADTNHEHHAPVNEDQSSKSESESADSSTDNEDIGEEIVLISHQQTESDPITLEDDKQLDDKIMSLRNLIADTCELGGGSSTDLTKKQDSVDSTFDLSSVTNMAPPPDQSNVAQTSLPEAPNPPPLPPIVSSNSASASVKQPPPPAPKPNKPPAVKPKPLKSTTSMEDELALKLQRRQLKMNEIDSNNSSSRPNSVLSSQIQGGSTTVGGLGGVNMSAGGQPTNIGANTGATATSNSTIVGGGGSAEMQAQLQMLQQQMMQQQMMQLQQQFQQLQSMMAAPSQSAAASLQIQQQMQQLQLLQQQQLPPGNSMGPAPTSIMMPPSGLPAANPVMGNTPSSLSLPLQYPIIPNQQLYGVNPSLMATPINQTPVNAMVSQPFQVPQQQQALPLPQPTMIGVPQPYTGSLMPPLSVSPAPSVSPTPSSPPPTETTTSQPTEIAAEPRKTTSLSRKPSEADIRLKAMGTATNRFDNLMDEVREANPTQILKKISVTEKEQGSTSPYTGMTAALVEAMRERRKSFHDSDTKRESIGQDWDEDQDQEQD